MEEQELLSFFFRGGGKKVCIDLQCVFGCDFLSPRSTVVLGIVKYISASMSCCFDGLAQLLDS